ncbi:MAG: putative toxin-antitoxin system toxin component, PIN family [Deltaproteobacteria bacterium]|nr:putative toxin-antitoxin system toxin component, PIN family [Candidatus Desulfobacula maris]MBL6994919.1 putative toxin-antitoxin system toxin component, PIN family [Desulfobacula sp.]
MLDTNILLSASFSKFSTSARVLEIVFQKHTVLASFETYSEIKEVIYRKKFDLYLTHEERKLFLNKFLDDVHLINPEEKISACRDPKDNMILELAVAGNADFIITGDQDLLVLNPFRDIKIVNPVDFLEIIKVG